MKEYQGADMAAIRNSRQTESRRCTEAFRDLLQGYKARFEDVLRSTGVTLAQMRMLKVIARQEDASAAAIARSCQITPQTLQSMLARATREGWILRGNSQRNARIVTATLTPRGQAILGEGQKLAEQIEAHIWQGVSLADMQTMREIVERGLANLHKG